VDVGSMWLLAGLVMFIWLVLILSVAWLTATRPERRARVPTDRAREILADRYARGEIDLDEYRDRLGAPREDELIHR
jgi:putative membrane protein